MSTQHTPTPWTYYRDDDHNIIIGTEEGAELGDDKHIATLDDTRGSRTNASFIVLAVNNFDALLEAAKATLAHLEELDQAWLRGAFSEHDGHDGVRSTRNHDMRVRLGRAIVAAAEGRSA